MGKGPEGPINPIRPSLVCCHTVLMGLSHRGWGATPRRYTHDGRLSSAGGSVGRPGSSSIPYARRNGRAFASLTARGGGLPIGVTDATQTIPMPGTYLLPGTGATHPLFWVRSPPEARAALVKNATRLEMRLVYCSLYEECWESTLLGGQLEPKPVPKRKPTWTFSVSQGWFDEMSKTK